MLQIFITFVVHYICGHYYIGGRNKHHLALACVQTGSKETDVAHELQKWLRVLLADQSLYIGRPVQCVKGLVVQPHESQTGQMTSI